MLPYNRKILVTEPRPLKLPMVSSPADLLRCMFASASADEVEQMLREAMLDTYREYAATLNSTSQWRGRQIWLLVPALHVCRHGYTAFGKIRLRFTTLSRQIGRASCRERV